MIDYKTNKMNINSGYGAYGSRNLCQEIDLPWDNKTAEETIGIISKMSKTSTVINYEGKTPANKDIVGHEFICGNGSVLYNKIIENNFQEMNECSDYTFRMNSGPEKGREFTVTSCCISRSDKSEYYI